MGERVWAGRPWRRITLGGAPRTVDVLRAAFQREGFGIRDWVDEMLERSYVVTAREVVIDVANVSVRDLGFTGEVLLSDICSRASDVGLAPCPVEAGVQLRLQYPEQPAGECLVLGMSALSDRDGNLAVLTVEHDAKGLWLSGFRNRIYYWSRADRFLFVVPPPAGLSARRGVAFSRSVSPFAPLQYGSAGLEHHPLRRTREGVQTAGSEPT